MVFSCFACVSSCWPERIDTEDFSSVYRYKPILTQLCVKLKFTYKKYNQLKPFRTVHLFGMFFYKMLQLFFWHQVEPEIISNRKERKNQIPFSESKQKDLFHIVSLYIWRNCKDIKQYKILSSNMLRLIDFAFSETRKIYKSLHFESN